MAYDEVTVSSTHSFWVEACFFARCYIRFYLYTQNSHISIYPTDTQEPIGCPVTCCEGTEGSYGVQLYPYWNPRARIRWMINVIPRPFYPQERGRVGQPGRFAKMRKFSGPCLGFELQTVHPVPQPLYWLRYSGEQQHNAKLSTYSCFMSSPNQPSTYPIQR